MCCSNKICGRLVEYTEKRIEKDNCCEMNRDFSSFESLKKAWKKAKIPSDREHVTKYILNNKNLKKRNFKYVNDLSFLRLTVDEK